jgi:hypothetical protein
MTNMLGIPHLMEGNILVFQSINIVGAIGRVLEGFSLDIRDAILSLYVSWH